MALWSLTQERVEELIRQMQTKKEDHDNLEKKHIYMLWEEDLDLMVVELDKHEA